MSKYNDMNDKIRLSDGEKEKLLVGLAAVKNENRRFTGIAAVAVCVTLAVLGVFTVKNLSQKPEVPIISSGDTIAEHGGSGGLYVPKIQIEAGEAQQDSIISFLVYNGHVYIGGSYLYNEADLNEKHTDGVFDEYADISQKLRYRIYPFSVSQEDYDSILGDFIGTCTDEPNLCTSEEDRTRTEKAFNDPSRESFFGMEGDYYSINGLPEERMLCCVSLLDDCRALMPFYCLNGITLHSGKDIFGDLLDLKNAKKIQWVTDNEWNKGLDEAVYYHDGETPGDTALKVLSVSDEVLNGFFNELYASVPVVRSEETYNAFEKDMYIEPSGHLYVTLKNGLMVKLRLFENGYVSCDCSHELLFKLSGENLKKIMDAVR